MRECEKIRKKFAPNLYELFGKVTDPRRPGSILYGMTEMLGTVYFKNLIGMTSMRSMTEFFEDERIVRNLYHYLGVNEREQLPHYQTINDLLCRVDPEEIQEIIWKICYQLIRRKSFDQAKDRNKWRIIVDATVTQSGSRKLNEHCLERCYNRGKKNETHCYYNAVLEAKLYLGNQLIASIGSEFIENGGADRERQKQMSEEAIKQDCEIKAFKRLAKRLKQRFPRLPVCILGDSLYASEPVMDICKENGWDYILRYKEGSAPSIGEEFENIPEKGEAQYHDEKNGRKGTITFVNDISYRKHEIHMVRCIEMDKRNAKQTFQYLTTMRIDRENAKKTVESGRSRWKIENQGFKRQKQEAQDITHACSWNAQALKNHYLLAQLADLIRKLYEVWYLEKQGIQKTQKKVSSDLLSSLYQPLPESEDTS